MAKEGKSSGKLLLLQGLRKWAMPSRSFSEGTQNVSGYRLNVFNKWILYDIYLNGAIRLQWSFATVIFGMNTDSCEK